MRLSAPARAAEAADVADANAGFRFGGAALRTGLVHIYDMGFRCSGAVLTSFSALVLTLIILVPVRPSRENVISMPSVSIVSAARSYASRGDQGNLAGVRERPTFT